MIDRQTYLEIFFKKPTFLIKFNFSNRQICVQKNLISNRLNSNRTTSKSITTIWAMKVGSGERKRENAIIAL